MDISLCTSNTIMKDEMLLFALNAILYRKDISVWTTEIIFLVAAS